MGIRSSYVMESFQYDIIIFKHRKCIFIFLSWLYNFLRNIVGGVTVPKCAHDTCRYVGLCSIVQSGESEICNLYGTNQMLGEENHNDFYESPLIISC